jgi:hypothetical protein
MRNFNVKNKKYFQLDKMQIIRHSESGFHNKKTNKLTCNTTNHSILRTASQYKELTKKKTQDRDAWRSIIGRLCPQEG